MWWTRRVCVVDALKICVSLLLSFDGIRSLVCFFLIEEVSRRITGRGNRAIPETYVPNKRKGQQNPDRCRTPEMAEGKPRSPFIEQSRLHCARSTYRRNPSRRIAFQDVDRPAFGSWLIYTVFDIARLPVVVDLCED